MRYFKNIETLEQLRKEYKRLVKENHPDNGGSDEAIKIINAEYEELFKVLKNSDTSENKRKYNMAEDEMLRKASISNNYDLDLDVDDEYNTLRPKEINLLNMKRKSSIKSGAHSRACSKNTPDRLKVTLNFGWSFSSFKISLFIGR